MRIRQKNSCHHQEAHPRARVSALVRLRPRYVWEFPNKGQPALVLFEVDNTGPHPGSTGVRINVFEKAKNVRSESVFWTGTDATCTLFLWTSRRMIKIRS